MITSVGHPVGVLPVAAKKEAVSDGTPTATTVKLKKEMFHDVYWVCRVLEKTPGDLLSQLASVQAAALYKRHETEIGRLKKMAVEESQIVRRAQERAEG